MNTGSAASSIYAKPVVPRIVLRPALASVLLHGLLLFMLTANWADSTRDVIIVKPVPKVINARLVDASEFKPKPKPKPVAPAPTPKPKPKAAPVAKPKPAPPAQAQTGSGGKTQACPCGQTATSASARQS